MNLYYSRICRKLGLAKTTVWGIAYRKATNFDGILTNKRKEEPFEILPNTDEFWFADPLLFEDNGKIWLFVEAYNYATHKGELGVFDVIDKTPQNFRIIIATPTHMSYPFVYKYNGEYYMIPKQEQPKRLYSTRLLLSRKFGSERGSCFREKCIVTQLLFLIKMVHSLF